MADALLQLWEVLRFETDKEKVTTSERQFVDNCMAKVAKIGFSGAIVSAAVVSRATRRFGHWNSAYLSAGSSFLAAKLMFNMSGNACLEEILNMEGSHIQRELIDIILRNCWENPSRLKLVQKHFYPEVVFSDLKPDESLVKWRARNVYVDGAVSEIKDDHGGFEADEDVETRPIEESTSNLGRVNAFRNTNTGGGALSDPLDCIFGTEEQIMDIDHAGGAESTGRRRRRNAHRRGSRKHHGAQSADALSQSAMDEHYSLPKLRVHDG